MLSYGSCEREQNNRNCVGESLQSQRRCQGSVLSERTCSPYERAKLLCQRDRAPVTVAIPRLLLHPPFHRTYLHRHASLRTPSRQMHCLDLSPEQQCGPKGGGKRCRSLRVHLWLPLVLLLLHLSPSSSSSSHTVSISLSLADSNCTATTLARQSPCALRESTLAWSASAAWASDMFIPCSTAPHERRS